MSREIKLVPFQAAEVTPKSASDDLRLQIDVRLHLDDGSTASPQRGASAPPSREELRRLAAGIYEARRKRDKMLAAEIFGEPAWDMLLALYCLPAKGSRLGVTSLSYAVNVPPATGHRIQAGLRKRGLIERHREECDARRHLVTLSEKGRFVLERYLASLIVSDRALCSHLGAAAA